MMRFMRNCAVEAMKLKSLGNLRSFTVVARLFTNCQAATLQQVMAELMARLWVSNTKQHKALTIALGKTA